MPGAFLVLLLLGPLSVLAASAEQGVPPTTAPDQPVPIEEIVVTATRIDQPLGQATADVTVLTRHDIEQSAAQTVDDFLRQVPGFNLFRRSSSLVAHPTAQGVSLRGIGASGSSRTLVLLDGIPLNDPFGGWVYWSKVPLESVERVEVVRGGTASVWGNYAMGGVINIITAHPSARTLTAVADGGNAETANLTVRGSDHWGAFGLLLEGNYFHTGGFPVVSVSQRGPIDINANSEHKTFNGRLEYALSPASTLFLSGSYFAEERGNGTPLTHNSTDTGYVGAGSRLTLSDGSVCAFDAFSNLQGFASTFSSQSLDRTSEQPSVNQFDVPTTAVGTSVQWSKPFYDVQVVTAGADLRWIDGATNENFRFLSGAFTRQRHAGGTQQFAGGFLGDSLSLSPHWQISLAGRVDLWRNMDGRRVEHDMQSGATTLDEPFSDRNRVLFNPTASVRYDLTDSVALRSALYQGFRAPTLNELYRPFRVRNDITEANGNLDPERLLGGELGINYTTPMIHGQVTGYWNDIRDAIGNVTVGSGPGNIDPCGQVPAGGTCQQRQNLDRVRIQGIELDLETRVNPWWTVVTGYLFDHTEVLSAHQEPSLEGKRIPQVPDHQLTIQLRYDNAAWLSAALQVRYVGNQFENDLNTLDLGGYPVVDLALSRQITTAIDVFFQVENLLDRTYDVGRTSDGLVTIGAPILVHGGLRVRL